MAGTQNFFALLDDDENEDLQAIATRVVGPIEKAVSVAPVKPAAKEVVPSTPVAAPTGPVRGGRGGARGGRGGDRGSFRGRGGRLNGVQGSEGEEGAAIDKEARQADGERGRGRGRGRAFHHHGDDRRHRREFDRHSGTGRGNEVKRHGAGAANWGVEGEIISDAVPTEEPEKVENGVEKAVEANAEEGKEVEEIKEGEAKEGEAKEGEAKEGEAKEGEAKKEEEEEEKQMTLQEYEIIREEKRKALLAKKASVRTVEQDKAFDTMQKVSKTAEEELVLFKLGPEKEKTGKKKGEDEDRPKTISINEFLKPAEGESFAPYRRGGRGGGRGGDRPRGGRGGRGGVFGKRDQSNTPQINTEDTSQFPTLG